jgi:pimeloyl-ACP methyl ester carboxylesterase
MERGLARHHSAMAGTFIERDGVLETEGRRIGWAERGPDDGRPVAYLHGQPGSRRDVDGLFSAESLERFGIRFFSIDRAGYGDTDAAGLDRRDVARDVIPVADHLGIGTFAVLAASMGGTYALTLAALTPDRVARLVLASPMALPYDDPAIIAGLSEDEQRDVELVRGGPSPEAEKAFAGYAQGMRADMPGLVRSAAARWSELERRLVASDWSKPVARSLEFGIGSRHDGYYEDGLRTVRPLEIDLGAVTCPVRILHGTLDDWEPISNSKRLVARLADASLLELHGMGHFGPWVWPDVVLALITGA